MYFKLIKYVPYIIVIKVQLIILLRTYFITPMKNVARSRAWDSLFVVKLHRRWFSTSLRMSTHETQKITPNKML